MWKGEQEKKIGISGGGGWKGASVVLTVLEIELSRSMSAKTSGLQFNFNSNFYSGLKKTKSEHVSVDIWPTVDLRTVKRGK
jgi:hypothetical protein